MKAVDARPRVSGMQAMALSINGDKAMFYNVRLLGAQDPLMDLFGTHYFNQCYIQGSIDFIFGGASSIYQVKGLILIILIIEITIIASIQMLGIFV